MTKWTRFRDVAVGMVLLAIPFFFLRAHLKDPSKLNVIDHVLFRLGAPVQYLAREMAQSVSSVWSNYIDLVEVRREVHRLERENARLRRRQWELEPLVEQVDRLSRLLELKPTLGSSLLSATVIGKEVSPYFRVIRLSLDRGEGDQLKPGFPVISSDGLVGQIRRTYAGYSDVLLTADRTSAVDVVVDRSGARGVLRGTGDGTRYVCRIEYLARAEDVAVGDRILTSGFGKRFPPNIPVGHISKVNRRAFGLYQDVEVVPVVDFKHLKEVFVMTHPSAASKVGGRR